MKEKLQKIQPVNPEISSIREEVVELIKTKDGTYKDKNTREIFYLITRYPETQKFISLVLKGIVSVSDIIEYKGQYFSHAQDISKLDSTEEFSIDEINADKFIFSNVFGDKDHRKISNTMLKKSNPSNKWETKEYENMNIDKNTNKKYYYDFDETDMENRIVYDKSNTGKLLEKELTMEEIFIINTKAKKALDILFNEKNYNSFKKIVEKSKLLEAYKSNPSLVKYNFSQKSESGDQKTQELFRDLRDRFDIIYKTTQFELKKFK